jgi:hypothetical protein
MERKSSTKETNKQRKVECEKKNTNEWEQKQTYQQTERKRNRK